MNTTELSFGQRVDPTTGLIQPWLVHGALDEIAAMDLSQKTILMFGAGLGDAWLFHSCKKLYVIERNAEWLERAKSHSKANGAEGIEYLFRPCNEGSGAQDMYCELPNDDIDVIINDDAYRTEICQVAVDYFRHKSGGILICDNWDQDFVWISPKAIEIMEQFKKHIHVQEDHMDHAGKPWKTLIAFI